MKRILLMILTLALCLPIFASCAREPDFYDVSTMLIPTDGQTAQPSNFPAEPPHLSVSMGNSSVRAWRGTHSWFVEDENGMGSGINADSSHPLECKDSIQSLKITKNTTLTLIFDGAPTSITVRRYKLSANDHDSYDEITVSGSTLEVKSGDYLYEVIASWSGQNYSGTVYYAFRTEK